MDLAFNHARGKYYVPSLQAAYGLTGRIEIDAGVTVGLNSAVPD